ncbi:DUF1559 family PulG-like putative transporter [Singulisphaera rosea]
MISERRAINPSKRFTLIDFLAVIAIIEAFANLTLPAVEAARKASRRAGRQNKLRQHDLAINNYATALDAFPISYIALLNPPGGAAPEWSWAPGILPQADQDATYNVSSIQGTDRFLGKLDCEVDLAGVIYLLERPQYWAAYSDVPGRRWTGRGPDDKLCGQRRDRRLESAQRQRSLLHEQVNPPKDITDKASNSLDLGKHSNFDVQNAWEGNLGNARGGIQVLVTVTGSRHDRNNPTPEVVGSRHSGLTEFLIVDGSIHPIKDTITPNILHTLATCNGRATIEPGAN